MKTRLIPVLMTAVLTVTAAQARPNDDDGERQHQRADRPRMAAPQQQQQQQQPQQPQRQSQPQQQTRPQRPQQPQGEPQQPQGEPRERERSGAAQPRGWFPVDPNRPSPPRGNPNAGNQGPRGGARPMPSAPNPNWQADRSRAPNWSGPQDRNPQRNWRDSPGHDWRANRGWYDRYRVDHFRFNGGRYFARQRYSVGGYAWPRGFTTRLWLAGEWLPSVFFIDGRYDLNDYWFYDLYEPPLGCRWTRVGNDALLIDEVTGEVLDVVYDLFW